MSVPLRVLLVEDDPGDAMLLEAELASGGFVPQIERVENCESLQQALSRSQWDIVISDYRLPQFDGLEALAMVRAVEADLPVILVSGNAGENFVVQAMRAGAQDYVLKNKLSRLVPAVKRALDDAEIRRQHREAEKALERSEAFRKTVLDSLVEHIAVLDASGSIVSVNHAWLEFAGKNGASASESYWLGINYLDACEKAVGHDFGTEAAAAVAGIRAVLSDERTSFSMEYACNSPTEQRWFVMHVSTLHDCQPGVVIAHENVTSRKIAELEVESARARLAELTLKLIQAQEQERKVLARELHDELGQRFTSLNITLHHLRNHLISEEANRAWQMASDEVAAMIQRVRDISSTLRPPMLDYLGLEAAIRQLLNEHFVHSSVTCVFEYAGLPYKLPAQVEITAYRIIQEAITNIVRHAEASQVVVELNGGEQGNELEIIVRDNGQGFDLAALGVRASRTGIGLMGMRERVMLLGGQFSLVTQPDNGTRIDVLLPLI